VQKTRWEHFGYALCRLVPLIFKMFLEMVGREPPEGGTPSAGLAEQCSAFRGCASRNVVFGGYERIVRICPRLPAFARVGGAGVLPWK
jgi:hypothetical protein